MKCHLKTLADVDYNLENVTNIQVMGIQGGFCITGHNDEYTFETDSMELRREKNIFGHRKSIVEFTCNNGQVMKYDIKDYSDTLSMYNQIQLALALENV